MAEDRTPTPEKQLLKLIEEGKGGEGVTQAKLKRKGIGALSLSALKGLFSGRFSFFKRSTQKKLKKKFAPDLEALNRVLVLAVVLLFVYVAGDAAASAMRLRTASNFAFQNEKGVPFDPSEIRPALKDAGSYLQRVNARDIFRGAEQFDRKVEKRTSASAPKKESPLKNLTLVGISWSANPDVIIEDKKRKKTFFLRRGQEFADGIKVKEVFKDKVVLSYEGEEIDLR